jgi:hypothetical protein
MPNDYVQRLIQRWRERATDYELDGQNGAAKIYRNVANELEAERTTYLDTRLSVSEAAAESGFTTRHIRTLRQQGIIGDTRRDLPRRPGHGIVRGPRAVPSDVDAAASDILAARRARRKAS